MSWIIITAMIISFFYFVLITIFFVGWRKTKNYVPKGGENLKFPVSLVIPCKNEEAHIRNLIACMAQQSNQNYELILVNDHSTDATRNYIKTANLLYPRIKLIDAVGYGKKNALKEGILAASEKFIICTDADCFPSYHWLESIAGYQQKHNCDLIICPVKLSGESSLFSSLQTLEFTSLVASAAGAASMGMPILCNGANLAFKKESWLKSFVDLHEEEQSGDDIFLLESIKKRGGKIRFLKSESAFVTTKQSSSLGQLVKQRRRWTAKSKLYTDWQLIATALIVLSISLVLLCLAALSFYKQIYLFTFFAVFLFKYLLDTIFLSSVSSFFQLYNIKYYSFALSLVYPFYISFIALSALVYRPKSWK